MEMEMPKYFTKTFSLDAETIRKLEELGKAQERTRSQIVRRLVGREYEAYFNSYKINETTHTLRE